MWLSPRYCIPGSFNKTDRISASSHNLVFSSFLYVRQRTSLPFFKLFYRAKIIFKGQMKGAANVPENKHPSGIILAEVLGRILISPVTGNSSCFTQHGISRNSSRYTQLTSCYGSPDSWGAQAVGSTGGSVLWERQIRFPGTFFHFLHSSLVASSLSSH